MNTDPVTTARLFSFAGDFVRELGYTDQAATLKHFGRIQRLHELGEEFLMEDAKHAEELESCYAVIQTMPRPYRSS